MDKNPIKNPLAPLLVGLEHRDPKLISKAREIIEQFGEKGKTLFIEGSKLPSWNESDPIDMAAKKAVEKGMKVVNLDASLVGKLKRKMTMKDGFVDPQLAGLSEGEFRYLMFQVRENRWINTLRKQAKGGDIVMAHPNHITRIRPELSRFGIGQNILLVSKSMTKKELLWYGHPPLSRKSAMKLKKGKAAKRAINIRLRK